MTKHWVARPFASHALSDAFSLLFLRISHGRGKGGDGDGRLQNSMKGLIFDCVWLGKEPQNLIHPLLSQLLIVYVGLVVLLIKRIPVRVFTVSELQDLSTFFNLSVGIETLSRPVPLISFSHIGRFQDFALGTCAQLRNGWISLAGHWCQPVCTHWCNNHSFLEFHVFSTKIGV